MDLMRAIKAPFGGEGWVRKFFYVLVSCLFMPLACGYMMEYARRVARGQESELPSFEGNCMAFIVDGLRSIVTTLVYCLPGVACMVFAAISIFCGGVFGSSGNDGGVVAAGFGGVGVIAGIAGLILMLLCSLLAAPAMALLLTEEGFGAGLQFGRVLAILRANIKEVLLLVVFSWIISTVLNFVGQAVFIGWIFTVPYTVFLYGHLYGQFLQSIKVAEDVVDFA